MCARGRGGQPQPLLLFWQLCHRSDREIRASAVRTRKQSPQRLRPLAKSLDEQLGPQSLRPATKGIGQRLLHSKRGGDRSPVGGQRSRLWPSCGAAGRPEHRRRRIFAGRSVGPRGFEPRTCGLRVWFEPAGQRGATALSWAFASLCFSSFPIVSRSFTGMRRGEDLSCRCHFL